MTAKWVVVIATVIWGLSWSGGAVAQEKRIPGSRAEMSLSFAPLVRQAAPAVVNIYTKKVVEAQGGNPFFRDPFFRELFGGRAGGAPQQVQRSLGSGVIVQSDGLVVTNDHVVAGATSIRVVLNDRREFDAEVIGADKRTDLAVLRLMGVKEDLPTLPLGDSDLVEIGDLVLAIGNPFGVGQTVTSGIVSALARTQVSQLDFQSFIQTDAAINPGNSGGALIDVDGRLVGVNTAIFTRSGGSNGIGFAVPVNMVRTVVAGIAGGRLVRPWLGAASQTVTADLAEGLGLDRPRGVLVRDIRLGSPASRIGLRQGDVITTVGGVAVNTPEELRFRIATYPPGGEVPIDVIRGGRLLEGNLPLEAPPEIPSRNETQIGGTGPFAGAVVANLNPALGEELGIGTLAEGVIVLRVRRGSVAHQLRVQPGDRVTEVNGRPINRVADLVRMRGNGSGRWVVTVIRNGRSIRANINL